MLFVDDVAHLVCPDCRARLDYEGSTRRTRLGQGTLVCRGCRRRWPVVDGLCRLYDDQDVRGTDRFMRFLYDRFAKLHDPAVTYTLPLMQVGSEAAMRNFYLDRVDLGSLASRSDGRPLRILDVGIGTGADLDLLRQKLPPGLEVEIWGVDLSYGMLRLCLSRLSKTGDVGTRVLMADAHALPFADGFFDRVFHVGGIAGYRDPARALREMARVAVGGTPIVVVDEQLDLGQRQNLYHRLMFRLVTFYDPAPHCPREHVPAGAMYVVEEQINRFFYCLTFRMPPGTSTPVDVLGSGRADAGTSG